jgi:hypothetical protein
MRQPSVEHGCVWVGGGMRGGGVAMGVQGRRSGVAAAAAAAVGQQGAAVAVARSAVHWVREERGGRGVAVALVGVHEVR